MFGLANARWHLQPAVADQQRALLDRYILVSYYLLYFRSKILSAYILGFLVLIFLCLEQFLKSLVKQMQKKPFQYHISLIYFYRTELEFSITLILPIVVSSGSKVNIKSSKKTQEVLYQLICCVTTADRFQPFGLADQGQVCCS